MVGESESVPYRPRPEWYNLRQIAIDLVGSIEKAGIDCNDAVFIGGIAFFFNLRAAFGGRVTMGWRGTHDIDLVVFGLGGAKRLIKAVDDSEIFEKTITTPSHFLDKWILKVKSTGGEGWLSENDRWVKIDLYGNGGSNNEVNLDGRILKPSKIVYDPPEVLTFENGIKVCVPSLRDLIVLKLNFLQHREFLWPSEQVDILGCLAVAEKRGIPLPKMLDDIYNVMFKGVQKQRAKTNFGRVCKFGWVHHKRNEFAIPSYRYLNELNKWVKQLKE